MTSMGSENAVYGLSQYYEDELVNIGRWRQRSPRGARAGHSRDPAAAINAPIPIYL